MYVCLCVCASVFLAGDDCICTKRHLWLDFVFMRACVPCQVQLLARTSRQLLATISVPLTAADACVQFADALASFERSMKAVAELDGALQTTPDAHDLSLTFGAAAANNYAMAALACGEAQSALAALEVRLFLFVCVFVCCVCVCVVPHC